MAWTFYAVVEIVFRDPRNALIFTFREEISNLLEFLLRQIAIVYQVEDQQFG